MYMLGRKFGQSVYRTFHSFTSGNVSVNEVNLYYEKHGNGKRILLLMPGVFGCCATDFKKLVQSFDHNTFTTVCWDPRGQGYSRPPERYFPSNVFHQDADDCSQLMHVLGYKKFSILGWSAGGHAAAILTAKHPEVVEKLVLWGSSPTFSKENYEKFKLLNDISKVASSEGGKELVHFYGEEYFAEIWKRWMVGGRNIVFKNHGNIYEDQLKHINRPTLIMHGMKDYYWSLCQIQDLHKGIRNSTLEWWEGGRHDLHEQFPRRFHEAVKEFLLQESWKQKNIDICLCS